MKLPISRLSASGLCHDGWRPDWENLADERPTSATETAPLRDSGPALRIRWVTGVGF
jgi:hypothetical protein